MTIELSNMKSLSFIEWPEWSHLILSIQCLYYTYWKVFKDKKWPFFTFLCTSHPASLATWPVSYIAATQVNNVSPQTNMIQKWFKWFTFGESWPTGKSPILNRLLRYNRNYNDTKALTYQTLTTFHSLTCNVNINPTAISWINHYFHDCYSLLLIINA